jgi:hypothetical protein
MDLPACRWTVTLIRRDLGRRGRAIGFLAHAEKSAAVVWRDVRGRYYDPAVDQLTIKVGPDFALGLQALACLDKTTSPTPDASAVAHELLRTTLIARLDAAGLPWAPSAEQAAARRAGSAGLPIPARVRSAWADTRARTMVRGALVVAALVALTGGYVGGWHWTGFRDNKQLWDWLQLLLLPVAFATLPLWLRRSQYMSRARRATYAAILVAFGVFVLIGYEMPLGWTGFTGNKLWDWLTLVLLPVALVTVRTGMDPHAHRWIRLELDVDRLPGQHALGLAAVGPASDHRPHRPGSSVGGLRLRQRRDAGPGRVGPRLQGRRSRSLSLNGQRATCLRLPS